jgi:hypothetical protein
MRIVPGVVAVLGLAMASPASARADQEGFRDQSAVLWSVVSLELYAPLAAIASGGDRECQDPGCVPVVAGLLVGAAAIPSIFAASASVLDLDPDLPFVVHESAWGMITGGLLFDGLAAVTAGVEMDQVSPAWPGLGGALGMGLAFEYALLRTDSLDQGGATDGLDLLTWGPPVAIATGGLVSALLFAEKTKTNGLVTLVPGILSTLVYAAGIAVVETARE